MLGELRSTAGRLGLGSGRRSREAERLPFEDGASTSSSAMPSCITCPISRPRLTELHRVLRPGGTLAFCGEPSRYGDLLAAVPKRARRSLAPLWRRLVGASARRGRPRRAKRRPRAGARGRRPLVRARPVGSAAAGTPASGTCGSVARSCSRTPTAGPCARSRGRPSRRRSRCAGGSSRFAATSRCRAWTPALLEPRLPAALFYNLVLSARKL